jgi:hypothetical protein
VAKAESLHARLARALARLAGLSLPEADALAALEREAGKIQHMDCKPLVEPPRGWVVESSEVLTLGYLKPPMHLFRATVRKPDGSQLCQQEIVEPADVETKQYWRRLWRDFDSCPSPTRRRRRWRGYAA